MEKIGKGSFTTAFLNSDGDVILASIDPVKEMTALFGICNDSGQFAPIEFVTDNVYKMKNYGKVFGLKDNLTNDQLYCYQRLRQIMLEPCHKSLRAAHKTQNYYQHFYNEFSKLAEDQKFPKDLAADLIGNLHMFSNYDCSIAFEISPRNVRAENGKLILLDCFFYVSLCDKVHNGDPEINSQKKYTIETARNIFSKN